ncbi:MAG: endonuclease/exonuclease/phosphatase family protein [Burkholderiales bacterium]
MIAATALPLLPRDEWWIRIFDFPRIQILLLAMFTFASYLALKGRSGNPVFVIALALSIWHQCCMMYPYTIFWRKQVQPSRSARDDSSISLLHANVLMSNRSAQRLREIIRSVDPDLILTVETDQWWQDQLKEFERTHPFTISQAQDNTYGMLLYSRLPLIDARIKFLVERDIPSFHMRVRLPRGREVGLHCLHPRPPFPTEDETATDRDAELLIVDKEIKGKDLPVIVLGDLNEVAWSRTNYLFQDVSGLLDPRIGRGFFNTFHAKYPFLRFPLDHFFHSNHFRLIELRRLPFFGSDHFPVLIALSYEPDAEREQEELHADGSEKEEAGEKIEKAI